MLFKDLTNPINESNNYMMLNTRLVSFKLLVKVFHAIVLYWKVFFLYLFFVLNLLYFLLARFLELLLLCSFRDLIFAQKFFKVFRRFFVNTFSNFLRIVKFYEIRKLLIKYTRLEIKGLEQ